MNADTTNVSADRLPPAARTLGHDIPARPSPEEPPRFLSREACAALAQQLLHYTSGHGRTKLDLNSFWRGDLRWARNRTAVSGNWRDIDIGISRTNGWDRQGKAYTNQLDAASLKAAVAWAEQMQHVYGKSTRVEDNNFAPVVQPYASTAIWSDATYAQTPEQRSAIASQLMQGAVRAGMLSAGYLSVRARGISYRTQDGLFLYAPQTLAQCSMTVRDPEGTGSGWAGASSYDWNRFDGEKLAAIALDKCLRSRNPVAIEPGRYTLIMEPQATFELASIIVRGVGPVSPLSRRNNEEERSYPFFLRPALADLPGNGDPKLYRRTRLGERLLDEHITISYEPTDPDLGVVPFIDEEGEACVPVTWINNGVLATLAYDRSYAQQRLHVPWGVPNSEAFRLQTTGPITPIEEMIATTRRGLLVTRFWGIDLLDAKSLLCTGFTRDGLWLIENGKLSHPVKNLRWTESPLFVFNNVEQVGTSVPVFSPETPAIAPPMKVKDFSFTALVDAV